ncbi:hypothetical protein ACTMTI_24330 [Nonomuraea sp. H19]
MDVRGVKACLGTIDAGGTLAIVWQLRNGPAVKVFISPDYAKEVE